MDDNGIFNKLSGYFFGMPRFAPALFAFFIFFALLLFHKELCETQRMFLIPALFMYAQGATIIGMVHRLIALRFAKDGAVKKTIRSLRTQGNETREIIEERLISVNNEKTLPVLWSIFLFTLHIVLFIFFLQQLVSNGIL